MGGVWVSVLAGSREAVEERFPWLRVVTVGEPSWITAEKLREIADRWIPDTMRFDIERPDGWLAATDANLARDGRTPDRRPRLPSDPPAAGPNRHQRIVWKHGYADEPIVLYAEIDSNGFEVRKVDEYKDGRLVRADRSAGAGSTFVSDYFIPGIDVINQAPTFDASSISAAEFEQVWDRAGRE